MKKIRTPKLEDVDCEDCKENLEVFKQFCKEGTIKAY